MRALILGLALIVGGCASSGGGSNSGGLPSRMPLALQNIYIETHDSNSEYYQALRQELMTQGSRVAEIRTETNTILRISRENIERRASSMGSSDRNAPREYQLIYTATYVVTVNGKELFFPENLMTYRNYTVSGGSNSSMMRGAEEASIVQNLARDMARQTIRKLTSLQ